MMQQMLLQITFNYSISQRKTNLIQFMRCIISHNYYNQITFSLIGLKLIYNKNLNKKC